MDEKRVGEDIRALHEEIDESPPRAAAALASSLFEDRVFEEIMRAFAQRHGQSHPLYVELATRKKMERAVPRTLNAKVELAHALNLLPASALPGIKQAMRWRNRAVHENDALTRRDKGEIERAVRHFRDMAQYLHDTGNLVPQEIDFEPPAYPRATGYVEVNMRLNEATRKPLSVVSRRTVGSVVASRGHLAAIVDVEAIQQTLRSIATPRRHLAAVHANVRGVRADFEANLRRVTNFQANMREALKLRGNMKSVSDFRGNLGRAFQANMQTYNFAMEQLTSQITWNFQETIQDALRPRL